MALLTRPSRGDLVSALNVALVLVPQSLAYATVAGVDPVYGLYAAVAAPVAGALVGSSRYLQTGPTAVTSLLTFGALAPLATPGETEFAVLAAVLAVLVGLVRLAIGLLRGGAISYLMSQPVVVSFTTATALLIIGTQLPGLLGLSPESQNPVVAGVRALARPGDWSPVAVALGAGSAALLLVGRRAWALFPAALLAVVAATAWSRVTGYEGRVVGEVSLSFASPGSVAASDVAALLLPAVVIALVGFAEPASIARRYAVLDRVPWNADRELVGQGLANVASGLVGGFPVGGSISRTALNRLSGATSRWSGALTGLVVLLVLPLVHLLADLPVAVLSGLVIGAVANLVDLKVLVSYWRWSRPQLGVAVVTTIATMALAPRVERGVLVGVGAALAVHLWRETRVSVPAGLSDGVLHLRPSGVLYFASAPAVERTIEQAVADHPEVVEVVLHLDRVGRLDLTGALTVAAVLRDLEAAGRVVRVDGGNAHARRLLDRVRGRPAPAPPPPERVRA